MKLLIAIVIIVLTFTVNTTIAQVPTTAPCHYTVFNLLGSSGADITVSNNAVLVMTGYPFNCQAMIFNNSANDMRCGQSTVTATANGTVVKGNNTLVLSYEAMQNWYCIRTGGSDAIANVTERRTQ